MSDLSTTIWALDKMQSGERGVRCEKEPELHGKLTVHGSGQALLCTVCGYAVKVEQAAVAEALEEAKWKPSLVGLADLSFKGIPFLPRMM